MAKILIVDDSPTDVEMFSEALSAQGHSILVACDGISAEKMVRSELPDLLILDIIMPQKDGFQVCRDLKANPSTHHIPIAIVSSKGEEADIFWGKKQGADAYLVKPFSMDKLLEVVDELLVALMAPHEE
ncbi:MAG: response regulator [Candidatus Omnitrophica bacterium]|nr:response regulator [Candidatus Omnitrophota bacterium]